MRLFACAGLWLAAVCLLRIGGALQLRAPHGIWAAPLVPAATAVELFAAAQVSKLIRWLCQHG